jgi:Tfp pilus assembly protein PilV
MKPLHKIFKNKQGFFLVDSMVSVLVLAIGLVALAGLFTQGIAYMHKAATREKAVQVAAERLELLKTMDGKTVAELDDMIETLNTNGKNSVQPDKTTTPAEKFTTSIARSANLTQLTTGTASTIAADQYVYPVQVTVTWTSPARESFVMSTYVTTSDTTGT